METADFTTDVSKCEDKPDVGEMFPETSSSSLSHSSTHEMDMGDFNADVEPQTSGYQKESFVKVDIKLEPTHPTDSAHKDSSELTHTFEMEEEKDLISVVDIKPDISTFEVEPNQLGEGTSGVVTKWTVSHNLDLSQVIKQEKDSDSSDDDEELEAGSANSAMNKGTDDDPMEAEKPRTPQFPKEMPCTCHTCGAVFLASISLEQHMRTHAREKAFMCDICGKGFGSSFLLKYHERIHKRDCPYKCESCNAAFAQISALKDHMRTHREEKRSDLKQGFGSSSLLKYPERIHKRDCPYKCESCNAAFAQISALKDHMRKHGEEKQSDLKHHKRSHTEEKPYRCDFCELVFGDLSHLKSHAKFSWVFSMKQNMKSHTGEKPFVCHVCPAAFAQKASLKMHMKIHATCLGETPYNCDVCHATCATSNQLVRHMMVHTRKKSWI